MTKGRLKMLQPMITVGDFRTAQAPEKITNAFYSSPEWRALIAQLIKERGRRCERCGRTNCRIFGDHKIEIQDGGALLDPNNVELLCGSHHTSKTNEERARRIAAPV